jgi:hypothetical protein
VNQLPHWVLAIYCGISNENGENIGNVAKPKDNPENLSG